MGRLGRGLGGVWVSHDERWGFRGKGEEGGRVGYEDGDGESEGVELGGELWVLVRHAFHD